MTEDRDKRALQRTRKYIDVVVEDALSSMLFRAAIVDISAIGMRVISDQYLPVGTTYTFTMKRDPFLRVRGQVRWIRPFQEATYHVGVLIVESSEEDQQRLTKYLELERRRLTK